MRNYLYENRVKIFLFLCYATIVFIITAYSPGMVYQPDMSGSRVRMNFEPFIQIQAAISRIRAIGLPGGAEASHREVIKYIVAVAYGFFCKCYHVYTVGCIFANVK